MKTVRFDLAVNTMILFVRKDQQQLIHVKHHAGQTTLCGKVLDADSAGLEVPANELCRRCYRALLLKRVYQQVVRHREAVQV